MRFNSNLHEFGPRHPDILPSCNFKVPRQTFDSHQPSWVEIIAVCHGATSFSCETPPSLAGLFSSLLKPCWASPALGPHEPIPVFGLGHHCFLFRLPLCPCSTEPTKIAQFLSFCSLPVPYVGL